VAILDPALPAERGRAEDWLPTAQLVICAAPPRPAAEIYEAWCSAPPAGVIADLASIKTPLLPALRRLQEAGGRVASFHPMFGPDKALLRDADVLLCETGDGEAEEMVESLFRPTTARLVRVPVEQHDRLMADLLSLAHAAAIAFAVALPAADHPVRSTTFQALEDLAGRVVQESPDVYYEIQALNPHSVRAVEKLQSALDTLLGMVRRRNLEGFRQLMELGRRRTTTVACHWAGES
jgi:chorismate mutase/prephenate dehydrogenase